MNVQTIGVHRVIQAGATLESAQALVAQHEVDVIYTDPPWGPQALHMFDTMRESEYQEWTSFLDQFSAAVDWAAKRRVFIYMGTKWAFDTAEAVRRKGFTVLAQTQLEYGSPVWWPSLGRKKRLEAAMIQMSRDPHDKAVSWGGDVHGRARCSEAIAAVPGAQLVYDPCVGLGLVAAVTKKLGLRFVGSEPSEERLANTIKILAK